MADRVFCVRMPYRVYLIENSVGRRYIGLSDDVERRILDHNDGTSKWTRFRGPWTLVWISHPQPHLGSCRKLETLLKRQKGGRGLHPLLITHGKFVQSRS